MVVIILFSSKRIQPYTIYAVMTWTDHKPPEALSEYYDYLPFTWCVLVCYPRSAMQHHIDLADLGN